MHNEDPGSWYPLQSATTNKGRPVTELMDIYNAFLDEAPRLQCCFFRNALCTNDRAEDFFEEADHQSKVDSVKAQLIFVILCVGYYLGVEENALFEVYDVSLKFLQLLHICLTLTFYLGNICNTTVAMKNQSRRLKILNLRQTFYLY